MPGFLKKAASLVGARDVPSKSAPPAAVRPPAAPAVAEHNGVWEMNETQLPEPPMIKLTLADGAKIHINPGAIIYMQALPEPTAGDKEAPKAKVVLVTGESLMVRQGTGQILVAAGYVLPKAVREQEAEASEE